MWSRRNFAPVLFLYVNNKPADDLLSVLVSFEHKQLVNKAAETTLIFRNDDKSLADDPRCFPNVKWHFRFGYFDDLSPIKAGIIRCVEPEYSNRKTLKIKLYDASINMTKNSSSKNWGRIPSSEIAKQLAKKYGFNIYVDASDDKPAKSFIQPSKVNDLQFLRDLAAEIDFEIFVDGDPPTLFYRKKPYDARPHKVLTYYDDPSEFSYVKSFKPKIKSLGPLSSGVGKANPNKGKGDSSKAKEGNSPALGNKENDYQVIVIPNTNGGGARTVIVPKPPPSKDQDGTSRPASSVANTKTLAQAARQQMFDQTNEANSEHPLTPSIMCGRIYTWAGLDKQLNGKWYCQEITYSITSTGSETNAVWKRNAKTGHGSKAKKPNNKESGNEASKASPKVIVEPISGKAVIVPGQPQV